jgi:beta-lactamase class A
MLRRALLLAAASLAACAHPPSQNPFAALEARVGGRVGVHVSPPVGASFGWRSDERFGMCSTFKLPLAGVVLAEADAGRLSLSEESALTEADRVPHHPSTGPLIGKGAMSLAALAEAAQKTSDNVAANVLLRRLGGPAPFTAKLRALGDDVTRLDRIEPEMNLVPAGEERDTTTPRAMADLTARLLFGDALSPQSRQMLAQWMVDTKTGLKRLRAGFPPEWRAGDKTGTAMHPSMPTKINDVAVAWTPAGPLVVAAYYEAPGAFDAMRPEDEAVLAEVGRIIAARFA